MAGDAIFHETVNNALQRECVTQAYLQAAMQFPICGGCAQVGNWHTQQRGWCAARWTACRGTCSHP